MQECRGGRVGDLWAGLQRCKLSAFHFPDFLLDQRPDDSSALCCRLPSCASPPCTPEPRLTARGAASLSLETEASLYMNLLSPMGSFLRCELQRGGGEIFQSSVCSWFDLVLFWQGLAVWEEAAFYPRYEMTAAPRLIYVSAPHLWSSDVSQREL